MMDDIEIRELAKALLAAVQEQGGDYVGEPLIGEMVSIAYEGQLDLTELARAAHDAIIASGRQITLIDTP